MIRKTIKSKIQGYFFVNPTIKLRVRQIERIVKVPLPSVIRYSKELTEEKVLKRDNIANIITYSADRTSKQFLFEKKLFNLQQLVFSGVVDYLIEELSNPTIMVFGSYSKGEDIEESDIDIYVQTHSTKEIKLEKYEKVLQRNIQLFTYKNIKLIKNKELANNIVNGILLNGFLEVFE